jgi:hypothetical protein
LIIVLSLQITAQDQDASDPSAMYIAIDPTQEIFGELPAAVNSES